MHGAPVTAISTASTVDDFSDSDSSSETTADKDADPRCSRRPCRPPQGAPSGGGGAWPAGAKARALVVDDAGPRPVRIRFTPVRYGERAPEKGASKNKRKYECPELQEQYEANLTMRAQLLGNKSQIEEVAAQFGCALTARKPGGCTSPRTARSTTRRSRAPGWGAQAQKLAVADDGYYYDFRHITQYIRDNSHTQLLSPRTGEP